MDLLAQARQAAGQLVQVVEPVAQRGVIVVAVAEPAVVQHEQVDAHILRAASEGEQLFLIELEIGGLPVVHEQRALRVRVAAVRDVPVDERVELTAHAAQTVGGIDEVGLGCLERRSGVQRPAEIEGLDADLRAGHELLIDVHARGEAAGVAQCKAVDVAVRLVRVRGEQRHERAGLHAGGAAHGRCALIAGDERTHIRRALSSPCAAERQQREIGLFEVHACAERPVDLHALRAAVDDAHAPRDDVDVLVEGVGQLDGDAARRVAQGDRQRLCALAARAGQPFELGLALTDAVSGIAQVERAGAVGVADVQHALAQISTAKDRALLRKAVKRRLVQGERRVGIGRQAGEHVLRDGVNAASPVDMQRVAARGQPDDVADVIVVQMEGASAFFKCDRHG